MDNRIYHIKKPSLFSSPLIHLKFFILYEAFTQPNNVEDDDEVQVLENTEVKEKPQANAVNAAIPEHLSFTSRNIITLLLISALQGTILPGATLGIYHVFGEWYFYAPCAVIIGCWLTTMEGVQGRLYGIAVGIGIATMVFFQEEILSALGMNFENSTFISQQFCLLGLCIGTAFLMNSLIYLARYYDSLENHNNLECILQDTLKKQAQKYEEKNVELVNQYNNIFETIETKYKEELSQKAQNTKEDSSTGHTWWQTTFETANQLGNVVKTTSTAYSVATTTLGVLSYMASCL